jgi:hypothetical protein
MTDDLFEKALGDLKVPDYAKELRSVLGSIAQPKDLLDAPRTRAGGSALASVSSLISQAKEQTKLQQTLQEAMPLGDLIAGLPKWEAVKTATQGFDALPYSEQNKIYQGYLDAQIASAKKLNPKADEFELTQLLRTNNPAPLKPERSLLENITDPLKGLRKGLEATAESAVGAIAPASVQAAQLRQDQQDIAQSLSAYEKNQANESQFEQSQIAPDASALERLGSEASSTLKHFTLSQAGEVVGNVLPSLLVTAGVGTGTNIALRGAIGAERALVAAQTAGKVTGAVLNSALTAGEARSGAYGAVKAMTPDELAKDPEWAALLAASGGNVEAAKEQAAQHAGNTAGILGAIIGGISAIPGAGSLEGTVADAVARHGGLIAAAKAPGALAATLRAAGATLNEGFEEGIGRAAQNYGAQGVAPDQKLLEGVGAEGTLGALGGLGGHVGIAGVEHFAPPPVTPAVTEPDLIIRNREAEANTTAPPVAPITIEGATLQPQADGRYAYGEGQTPNDTADAVIAAQNARVAAVEAHSTRRGGPPGSPPATAVTSAVTETRPIPGTQTVVAGSTLVVGPDGTWAYGEGQTPNASADTTLATLNGTPAAPVVATPAAPVVTLAAVHDTAAAITQLAHINSNLQQTIPGLLANDATRFQGLRELGDAVRTLTPDQQQVLTEQARNSSQIHTPESNPLLYAVRELGLNRRVQDNPDAVWAANVRSEQPIHTILQSIIDNSEEAGHANAIIAAHLLDLYRQTGQTLPTVSYGPQQGTEFGSYNTATHALRFNPTSTADTVLHETIHSLTSRALNDITARAARGEQQAVELKALLDGLLAQLQAAGNTRGTHDLQEMFAELVKPEMLALAANTSLDVHRLSASAQGALNRLGPSQHRTLLDAIAGWISRVLNMVHPGANVSESSILHVLQQIAAQAVNHNASITGTATAPVAQEQPAATEPVAEPLTDDERNHLRTVAQDVRYDATPIQSLEAELSRFGDRLTDAERTALLDFARYNSTMQMFEAAFPLPDPPSFTAQQAPIENLTPVAQEPVRINSLAGTPVSATFTRAVRAMRWNAGGRGQQLSFYDPIDGVIYLARTGARSNTRPAAVAWLHSLGMSQSQIDLLADSIRSQARDLSNNSPAGAILRIPQIVANSQGRLEATASNRPQVALADVQLPSSVHVVSAPTINGREVRFDNPIVALLYPRRNNSGDQQDASNTRFLESLGLTLPEIRQLGDAVAQSVMEGIRDIPGGTVPIGVPVAISSRRVTAPPSEAERRAAEQAAIAAEQQRTAGQRAAEQGTVTAANPALPSSEAEARTLANRTFSQQVIDAIVNFARNRGHVRGVRPVGALGQLIPASATAAQKNAYFLAAMQAGVQALNDPAQYPRIAGRLRLTHGANGVKVYIDGNYGAFPYSGQASTSSWSSNNDYGRESSAANFVYDLVNGAMVSARKQVPNGGYTSDNSARIPINRLRAMLKWGAITGDMENAVHSLTTESVGLGDAVPNIRSQNLPWAEALNAQIQLVMDRARRYMLSTVGNASAPILFNPETQRISIGSRSYSFPELRAATLVPGSGVAPTTARISTASTIGLTALVNSLRAARTDDARQAILNAGLQTDIFDTIFSMPDDASDESLANIVFSLPDTITAETVAAEPFAPDAALPRPRDDYGQLHTDVRDNVPATPSSPSNELTQALRRRDWSAARHALAGTGKWLNEQVGDHLIHVKDWINALPGVAQQLRDRIEGALRRAPGVRDDRLNDAMENNGGQAMNRELAAIASKYNTTVETIRRNFGFWITAQRAPAANALLIQRDTDAVLAVQRQIATLEREFAGITHPTETDTAEHNAALAAASRELSAAVRQLTQRSRAVNNPETIVKRHVAGVGGFNNAQARQLAREIESKYDVTELQAVAKHVHDLNAWVLATNLENGKTSPEIAVTFLRQPGLLPLLQELRDLGATTTAENADKVAALVAKRAEVKAAVHSNYVPLSGDPNTALTEDLFYHGSSQPNVARDYRMDGRTTSIPDDGISTTFAAVLKAASYAGWRDFQDGIAEAHAGMTREQREEAGIVRHDLGHGAAPPAGAIVRRRNGRAVAYELRDKKLLEDIRGASLGDANNLFTTSLSQFTRVYSYFATQLAPWFAPKNFIRDFWDRSEILRTRVYRNAQGEVIDSNQAGRAMMWYMGNPAKLAALFSATGRHGFGMSSNSSKEARYLDELLSLGGASVFGDRFAYTRTDMVKAILREQSGTKQLRMFKQFIAKYNRTFELGPALAGYIALRDAGVSPAESAAGVLDLMNFRKRGAASAYISSLYAFAQPSITSGINTFASLGTRRGQVRLVGYTIALLGVQALARHFADDDEGGNKLDEQSDFVKNTHLLIPFGDGVIKIPLAFGSVRIANGMARALIGVQTKEQTPGEALGKLTSGSLVPVISPIEDTNIDWTNRPIQAFLVTFAPTWAKPIVSVGLNQTAWGTPVVRDNYEDTTQYRSEQFGKNVSPTYKDIAIFLRHLPFHFDLSPEEVKALIHGYPLGPGTMLINGLIENPYKESKGQPAQSALWSQVYAGYSDSAIYFQFQEALGKTDDLLKAYNVKERDFSDQQVAMLAWRKAWDDTDSALRKEKGAITRDKTLAASVRAQKEEALKTKREHAITLALYSYRVATGQPATRVEVPKEALQ